MNFSLQTKNKNRKQTVNMTATSINLANLELIVLLDQSGSMGSNYDTPSKKSRWDHANETIAAVVADVGKHDDDGITIIPFNASYKVLDNVRVESFNEQLKAIKPGGGTSLAGPLKAALERAEKVWKEKQGFILVLTDGEPSDRAEVAKVIIAAANKMERDEQCAILFARVGQDSEAKKFLESLDDDLQGKGAKFDIVDTKDLDDLIGKSTQEIVDTAFND